MFYPTESRPQTWRALAIFKDGNECLIFLGRSTTQVRAGYKVAFMEVLEEDERAQIESIALQCWDGAPDRGQWVTKTTLTIPDREKIGIMTGAVGPAAQINALGKGLLQMDDDDDEEQPEALLPFRTPEKDPLALLRKAVNS